jgi:hypothetical protein
VKEHTVELESELVKCKELKYQVSHRT